MLFAEKTIEDLIVEIVKTGPCGTVRLLELLQKKRSGLTKQGFYKSLRSLKTKEIVVIRNKVVSLSHVWISKMSRFFDEARKVYSIETQGEDFLLLKDGEKVSYTFKTPAQTDMFWGHAFSVLSEHTEERNILLFNPHEWFLLARNKEETSLFEELSNKNKNLFILVGNNTKLDIFAKTYLTKEKQEYHTLEKSPFEKPNYYVNIFGDFVIEALLDEKTSEKINQFYKETNIFDDDAKNKIKEIVSKKGKDKFIISKNHRKAEKIRNLFKKYFHLPK